MLNETIALSLAAAGIAFVHTLTGPDHYLPFVGLARAGKWSLTKTVWITVACGLAHVTSSVVIGLIGIAFGLSLAQITPVESLRGSLAAWGLIGFGLAYAVWGLRFAWRNKPHSHWHLHHESGPHRHEHTHQSTHLHTHEAKNRGALTSWTLFAIFLFGPCEPLIPLMMYPAAINSTPVLLLVVGVFTLVTLATMLGAVMLGCAGFTRIAFSGGGRYAHVLAGTMILTCGLLIESVGL